MLRTKHNRLFLLVIILFSATVGLASESEPPLTTNSTHLPDSTRPAAETVTADSSDQAMPGGTPIDVVILEPEMYRPGADSILISAFLPKVMDTTGQVSPTGALLRSVVFPGWGQYANGRKVKAGLIFAIESWFIYKAVKDGADAADWRDKWKSTPDSLGALKLEYFNQYTKYRDQRNTNIWYTAITVFLSMFDAYVDAHLGHFPEEVTKPEDISIDVTPAARPRLIVSYRF